MYTPPTERSARPPEQHSDRAQTNQEMQGRTGTGARTVNGKRRMPVGEGGTGEESQEEKRARREAVEDSTHTSDRAEGKKKRRREEGEMEGDESRGAEEANTSDAPLHGGRASKVRNTRSTTSPASYDETKRKEGGKKPKRLVYIDVMPRRRGKRKRIKAGAATLERTVGERYEWRDDAHTVKRWRS